MFCGRFHDACLIFFSRDPFGYHEMSSRFDRRCGTEVHEFRRLEVINGELGRRKWSAERKGEIVAESMQPGVVVSEVARRHNLTPQQLFS